jgi:two-component system response regulator YesN
MDGLELAANIRTLPGSQHEIVILSGFGEFEYAQQAIKYGVSEYILKPVTKETLSDTFVNIAERLKEQYLQSNKLRYANLLKKEKDSEEKVNFYERWFIRKVEFSSFDKELEQYEIRTVREKGPYFLILAQIDDYAKFSQMNSDNDLKLCQFIILNILNEIAQTFGAFDSVMLPPNLYIFLFQVNPDGDAVDETLHIGNAFQQALKKYIKIYDVHLSVGEADCVGIFPVYRFVTNKRLKR